MADRWGNQRHYHAWAADMTAERITTMPKKNKLWAVYIRVELEATDQETAEERVENWLDAITKVPKLTVKGLGDTYPWVDRDMTVDTEEE